MKLDKVNILLLGFLISFCLFEIIPHLFYGAGYTYFAYLPSYPDKIGIDLAQMLSFSQRLLHGENIYGNANLYAPLVSILFVPFAILDFRIAYTLLTICTFLAYISLLVLAQKIVGKITPEIILIFVSGICSYGFAFECERAQFYLITFACLAWAIYLYHSTSHKYWAWGLFAVAIQLKIFPVFFVWLMIDHKNAKSAIKNLLILGSINLALLFVLGYSTFVAFLHSLPMDATGWVSIVNHSLKSWTICINRSDMYGLLFLLIAGGWIYACKKSKGFDHLTLFYFTLTALLLPSISHDYSLPILVLPMALIVSELNRLELFVVSLLYSSMLFSYEPKKMFGEILLLNNGTALLILAVIIIWIIRRKSYGQQ
jgi:hypothetical protein